MATPETSMQQSLATAVKAGIPPAVKHQDGALIRVALTALTDNPYQPRSSVNVAELEELVAAIRSQGLLQPIAVRPQTDGSFVIVAGHRRVTAFRKLLEAAESEAERQKYATIPAMVMLALDNAQLAARAYQENVARAALNPLEEALALERMAAEGLAVNVEELAKLTGQAPMRLKRLRRLAAAPKVVKDAMSNGLMVVVGQGDDGKEKRELKHLEFFAALAFQRLWEHLHKATPRTANERTEKAVRRSLAQNWSLKRTEEYVQGLVSGKAREEELDDTARTAAVATLFTRTARRFVVELPRATTATPSQLEALREAFDALFGELSRGRGTA